MNANTVIAICATVIAVASLVVSVSEARAARTHNRLSVQPLLELTTRFPVGGTAGLRLSNSGLGPSEDHWHQADARRRAVRRLEQVKR